MASKSLRLSIPKDLIVLWKESVTVPPGFVDETTLFSRYAKGVPDNCTDPGTTGGASTHTHSASATHSHTSTSPTSHTHSAAVAASGSIQLVGPSGPSPGQPPHSSTLHTHGSTSTSGAPTWNTSSADVNPDHPSATADIVHKTVKYIKKTSTVSLRQKSLPPDAFGFWNKSRLALPQGFSSITSFFGKHLKGVVGACTVPDSCSGVNTHQHATGGLHTHSVTFDCHGHAFGTLGTGPGGNVALPTGSPFNVTSSPHTHGVSSLAITSKVIGPATSDCNATHQHSSNNHEPAFHQLIALQQGSISSRRVGLPVGFIAEWVGLLADIPAGFAIADGTSGTPDLRAKYIKIVPDGCTDPGGTGGSTTHTHDTLGAHTHALSFGHTHVQTGTSAGATGPFRAGPAQTPPGRSASPHSHAAVSPGGSTNISGTIDSSGSHCHGTGNNDPSNIEVAHIQRL